MSATEHDGNPKMRLVVEVKARLDWLTPAENDSERIMREAANNEVAATAHELKDAVQLLVALMLTRRT